jgi:hypothetical protein
VQGLSVVEWGEWLVTSLDASESALAAWLDELAGFDEAQGWAADGQVSCVDWLMWRARMSRSTAYERLQVARQLACRPALREAFRSGEISYSAVRLIARMNDPDPEVDEAVIELAKVGTVRKVERVVAAYQRHEDQDRYPGVHCPRRGVRSRENYDGTTTIEITLTDLEAADVLATLDAFMAHAERAGEGDEQMALDQTADQSARADIEGDGGEGLGSSGDQSARADIEDEDGDEGEEGDGDGGQTAGQSAHADIKPLWGTRRADAFVDLARTAIKHLDEGRACGDDRFLVHVIATSEGMTLLDGTPLDDEAAARLVGDSAATTLLLGPNFEPLAMGRKTREWTTAQRRAVQIRDGGQCRFPGCRRRRYLHTHHHEWWTKGGSTDVANGFLGCSYHHHLIHGGWEVEGEANETLTFRRPDGSTLGATTSVLVGQTTVVKEDR